jgi:hypothetical protein
LKELSFFRRSFDWTHSLQLRIQILLHPHPNHTHHPFLSTSIPTTHLENLEKTASYFMGLTFFYFLSLKKATFHGTHLFCFVLFLFEMKITFPWDSPIHIFMERDCSESFSHWSHQFLFLFPSSMIYRQAFLPLIQDRHHPVVERMLSDHTSNQLVACQFAFPAESFFYHFFGNGFDRTAESIRSSPLIHDFNR